MVNINKNAFSPRYVMTEEERKEAKLIIADYHKRIRVTADAVRKHRERIIKKAENRVS